MNIGQAAKAQARLLAGIAALVGKDLVTAGEVERWPVGIFGLNEALGGGLPKRRFVEIHGPSDGGKTSSALEILRDVAEIEAEILDDPCGKRILFMDHEASLDLDFAERVTRRPWGRVTKLSDLGALWPDHGILHYVPETFEADYVLTRALLARGKMLLSVHDSLASMIPRDMLYAKGQKGAYVEKQDDTRDERPAKLAQLFGRYLPRLKHAVVKAGAGLIYLNHAKKKSIGHIGPAHLAPWDTVGGENPKFYADVRIRVIGGQSKANPRGRRMYCSCIRNKTAPGRNGMKFVLDTTGQDGVDRGQEALDLALEAGILKWVDAEGEACAPTSKLKHHLADSNGEANLLKEFKATFGPTHYLYPAVSEYAVGRDWSRKAKEQKDDDDAF